MCGIAGIVPFNRNLDQISIEKMVDEIIHRGPDQRKVFKNSLGIFGFVRLNIIDLTNKSNQPFLSRNKKIQLIYNGEIYNYKSLKKKYFKDTQFKSNGDGEVLIYLYEKFGINFLDKIKGMFSICIIDENLKKIFLIRDRFGIKPLYYKYEKKINKFSFCSEIGPLVNNANFEKKVNIREAHKFFTQGLINSTNETWFKNIFQVRPSHYIEFFNNKISEKKYYHIERSIDETESKTFKEYIEDFKEKIQNSFLEHNQFDVEAGIHLSGGVDSAVLAAISNYNNKSYKSYTFDFNDKKYSELKYAKLISNSTNMSNFSAILDENYLSDYLIKVLKREFEPFSSLRVLCQHHLYDTYKENCKVILDGSGGDEVGAGYSYHMISWYLDIQKKFRSKKNKIRFYKYLSFIKNETISNSQFINGAFSYMKNPGGATIDGSAYKNNDIFEDKFFKVNQKLEILKPFKSYLRNSQYADLFYLKLPRSLKYADRASMYNSIETRVPFLDHEIVESSLKIPSEFKLLKGQQRIIMKYPFRNFVNKDVLYLNKRTIADPKSKWLKGPLKTMFFDLINSNSFNSHGIFKKKEVIKYYNNFLKYEKHFNSFLLFQILIAELWFSQILKN